MNRFLEPRFKEPVHATQFLDFLFAVLVGCTHVLEFLFAGLVSVLGAPAHVPRASFTVSTATPASTDVASREQVPAVWGRVF